MDSHIIERTAIVAMARKAAAMNVSGVAGVMVVTDFSPNSLQNIKFQPVKRYHREPDPKGRGEDDIGTNYGAVVSAKIWQVFRTGEPSGKAQAAGGENQWRGALLLRTKFGTVICGFSGGTQQQDVEIADAGVQAIQQALLEDASHMTDSSRKHGDDI